MASTREGPRNWARRAASASRWAISARRSALSCPNREAGSGGACLGASGPLLTLPGRDGVVVLVAVAAAKEELVPTAAAAAAVAVAVDVAAAAEKECCDDGAGRPPPPKDMCLGA